MDEVRILFISAAPRDSGYVNIPMERENIELNIQRAPRMDLRNGGEIRQRDLSAHVLKDTPHIVHFSGHGQKPGIVLLDDRGNGQVLNRATLRTIFTAVTRGGNSNIRMVFLNACDSTGYAAQIAGAVGCAIGIRGPIGDDDAIQFSSMFYRNIAFGLSVKDAFELSRTDTWPNGLPANGLPQLHVRRGVDAGQINPVQQLFKGYLLLAYPSLWNNYALVVNLVNQVHHTFQYLNVTYITRLLRELDKMVKTEGIADIMDFQSFWRVYTDEYNRLMTEYDHLSKSGNPAFVQLKGVGNPSLGKEFAYLYENYHSTIGTDIGEYRDRHKDAAKLIMGSAFARGKEVINEAGRTVLALANLASNLLSNSDNLLKRLVGVLLAE